VLVSQLQLVPILQRGRFKPLTCPHSRFRLLPQQNVSTANDSGNTALHWACLMGQEAVVRLLLEAGASAFALNK